MDSVSKFKGLGFRPASHEDIDLIFKWVNDPEVRYTSFSQDEIAYSEHQRWFNKKLESRDCKIFA